MREEYKLKKQEKLILFAKVLAVVGVVALVLLVGFAGKEESFVEPPKPTQIEANTDKQVEVVESTGTEEIEEKKESEIPEEEQQQNTNEQEQEKEDTVVVLPFVPAQ